MSPRIQVSNKRKSTPNHRLAEESRRIEDGDYDTSNEEEEEPPMQDLGFHKEDLQPRLLQFWLKS